MIGGLLPAAQLPCESPAEYKSPGPVKKQTQSIGLYHVYCNLDMKPRVETRSRDMI